MARRNFNKKKGNSGKPNGSNDISSKLKSSLETVKKENSKLDPKSANTDKADKEPDSIEKYVRKTNDPAWYMYSPEQVAAVAKLPFSEAFGDNLPVVAQDVTLTGSNNQTITIKAGLTESVPGIASIRTRPCFGANFSITDPLNVSATELYTFVRYANNGRKNYDPSDLFIHVLSIADIYAYIMWMKKVYGLAFMYSTRNFFIGKPLLAACGVDPDSMVQNLANLRYWLNTFINKVAAYVVPESINLFKRRAFMYSDVYTESDTNNIKDQLYTFRPDGFFKFALDGKGAGMLTYVTTKNVGLYSFSELCALGEELLENITQDEDFGLMSGDLLKAFAGNIIKIDPLPEIYVIEPHYDHEVLDQIMNATLLGNFDHISGDSTSPVQFYRSDVPAAERESYYAGNVYQDKNGILIHALALKDKLINETDNLLSVQMLKYINVLLNTDDPVITEDKVMEMTRLTATMISAPDPWVAKSGSSSEPMSYISCGSDIVTNIQIYSMDNLHSVGIPGSRLSVTDFKYAYVSYDRFGAEDWDWVNFDSVRKKIAFKYLPPIYGLNIDKTNGQINEVTFMHLWQNLENYTFIDPLQLDRIHRVAMYSLAHVPGVSRSLNS